MFNFISLQPSASFYFVSKYRYRHLKNLPTITQIVVAYRMYFRSLTTKKARRLVSIFSFFLEFFLLQRSVRKLGTPWFFFALNTKKALMRFAARQRHILSYIFWEINGLQLACFLTSRCVSFTFSNCPTLPEMLLYDSRAFSTWRFHWRRHYGFLMMFYYYFSKKETLFELQMLTRLLGIPSREIPLRFRRRCARRLLQMEMQKIVAQVRKERGIIVRTIEDMSPKR